MAIPTTRTEFKDWCLRQLGSPVIQINVDADQIDDRIDEAIQYFQSFHFDASELWYTSHQLTPTDISNRYITTSDTIIGVTRVFPISSSNSTVNMFNLNYQIRLNDLPSMTSTSYSNYVIIQQHLRTLDMLFNGEIPIRYNRHTNKVYLDWDWDKAVAGDYIVIEGYMALNPVTWTPVYNDRMLKKLATAYIKKQWGANMKKYGNMPLVGGLVMNGQIVHDEAVVEIKELEDEIRSTFEEPPRFQIG